MKKLRYFVLFALFLVFSCLGLFACNEREIVPVEGYGVYVHENGTECTIVQLPDEVLGQSVWEIPETLGEYRVVQVGDTTRPGLMSSPEEIIGSFGRIRKMVVPATVKMIRADRIDDVLVFQTEVSPSSIQLASIDNYGYSPTTSHWWQCPQEEAGYQYLSEENYDGDLIYIMEGEVGQETATLLAGLGSGELTVPQTFKGVPVTKLFDYAFYKGLYTSVTIEENVIDYGEALFAYSSIENVSLSMSCQEIPDEAFYGSALKSIDIPSSVTRIGEYAFYRTALTEITLPSSIVEADRYAFAGTPLNFADLSQTQLTTIAPAMFYHCSLADGVRLPDTIQSIQSNAFAYTQLTSFAFPAQLKVIAGEAFRNVQLSDINLPEGIEEILNSAFANNLALTELRLPDSCLKFKGEALYGCLNLKNLHLGNVEDYFYTPPDLVLDSITVSETNKVLYVDEGILYRRNEDGTTTLLKCPQGVPCESIVIRYCLLAYGAFYMHPTLREVTILYSGSAYEIPASVFYGCSALEKVVLPEANVDSITINSHVFYQCINLTEINTKKVENFYSYSFKGCSSLKKVDLTSAKIIDGRVFQDCDLREVHTYQLKRVGYHAFANNVNLKKVTLENCENISLGAFKGCKRLTSCTAKGATVDSGAFAKTPLAFKYGVRSFFRRYLESRGIV